MAISGGDGSIVLTTKVDESGLSKGLSSVKGAIGKIGGVVAGAAVAVAGLTTAFVAGAKSTAEYGDRVDKLSQKIGMSKESFQQWDYIMQINGSSIETLQMGMKTLSQQAQQGADEFTKLGLSQEFVKSASPEELFESTITALQGMEEGTERTAIASTLLGRSATELAPLFNSGAESVEALKQQAIDYGMVMSDDAVAASAAFQDSLTTLSMTTTGLKNKMMGEFLPSITSVTDGLALLFTGDMSGLDKINDGINQFVGKISEILPQILEIGGSIITSLAMAIIDNLPTLLDSAIQIITNLATYILGALPQILKAGIQILLSLIQGLTDALPQLIAMLPEIINTIITVLIENLPLIIEAGIQLLIAIVTGLAEAIPQLIDYIPTIIDTMITTLLDNLPLIIDCAIQLLVAIITGLIQALPQLVAMTPQIIWTIVTTLIENLPQLLEAGKTLLTSVIDGIKSILSKMGEVGKNIVEGLWNGIKNAKDWLLNKIKSFATTITDGIKSFFGIHSPSTVMRDEVGKMIPKGMAIGIDKAKNLVTKATKALVTDTRSEVQKVIDDMNEEILESEKKYAEESLRIQKEKEEKEYEENIENAKKQLEKDKENAKKQLAEKKKKAKTSEEIAEANAKHEEEIAEANAKYEEKIQAINNERAQKEQEKANEEYLDNLKETAEKERKIYDARQKDIENAKNDIVNAYEQMANEALDSIKNLQDAQDNLSDSLKTKDYMQDAEEIKNAFGIDEYFKDNGYLKTSFSSETKKLEQYSELMLNLKDREGMTPELWQTIRDMSFEDSLKMAKQLTNMSDARFTNYINSWAENQRIAQEVTEALFEDEEQPNRLLTNIAAENEELKEFAHTMELVKDRGIPDELFDELRNMPMEEGMEFANALLSLTDEDFAQYLIDWQENQKLSKDISKQLYKDEAEELATEIGDKFEEVEKEFFGVGENSADEFEDGFMKQLQTVIKNIKQTISGAFSGITPDANYGIGGYSINVPALARGSVLPGGKPFLAIVNDQPRGQTNVEAPLSTIEQAVANVLNRQGGSGGGNSTVIMQIDGREFGRAVIEQGERETRRIGTKLVTI